MAGPSTHAKTSKLITVVEALARRIGDPSLRGVILLMRGTVGGLEGRWRDCLDNCFLAEQFIRNHCTALYWEIITAQAFQMLALLNLGEIARFISLCPRMRKEAQNRGDLQTADILDSNAIPFLHLASDQAEEGFREISVNISRWSRTGNHVQHFQALFMKTQVLLYLNEGLACEQVAGELRKGMHQLQLYRVQHMRIAAYQIMAQTQLAAARKALHAVSFLSAAERNALRLGREGRHDARAYAMLIRAGVANCKGDLDRAKRLLEEALSGFVASELGLFAAATRRRLGQLLGGDRGNSLVAEADHWMTTQGIRNPMRMTAVYAPGFADP
jgi:hypothetical protein